MTETSPNLEVVSSKTKDSNQERRRLPRLNLAGEQFRHDRLNKIFSVVDLSPGGMALQILEREDLQHFPMGVEFDGTLNVQGEKIRLKAFVRHWGQDTVGCQFASGQVALETAIAKHLDPVTLGQELKPIPSSETGSIYYRGSSGTHLYLWRSSDGQYHRMALYVLGSYIYWDAEQGLVTGRTSPAEESSEVRGIFRMETMLLEPDQKPDPGKLGIAKTLLQSSNLPQDLKSRCIRHLA